MHYFNYLSKYLTSDLLTTVSIIILSVVCLVVVHQVSRLGDDVDRLEERIKREKHT